MRLILVGMSHRTAPVEVRERIVFSDSDLKKGCSALGSLQPIAECALLSTCNRTEILAARRKDTTLAEAVECIREFLASSRPIGREELDRYLYVHEGADAVRHLFRVASSLDSMIIGEPQILGQVKDAYYGAVQAGTVGPHLDPLFQRAFGIAKKVRTQTQVGRNPVSVSQAATELARRIFGSLESRIVMVLGSGQMAELAASHLVKAGVKEVFVASRTFQRAQATAKRVGGHPVPFDKFYDHLADIDIVISSTAAPHHVVSYDTGARVMKGRRGRPIFFIDIAVPRDIDPALNRIDNIYLYDIDDLQRAAEVGMEERLREANHAEAMIEDEVARYLGRSLAKQATPSIIAMREKLHAMGRSEIRQFRGKLGPLSEKQESAIQALVASLIRKILHGPTREIKRSALRRDGEALLGLVHRMFDLRIEENVEDRREGSEQ